MTRIVVLPADETACGFYRMRCPAGVVSQAREDWTIEVYRPSDVRLGGLPNGSLQAIYGIPDPQDIDLLVMQRVGTRLQYELLEWANRNGIATVLDTDDAMWAIHPDNSSYKAWNGGTTDWRWLDRAAPLVDLMTVTTPALAKRYEQKGARVEVLPNCVPEEAFSLIPLPKDDVVTIGWAGFTSTHPNDLQVVGNAVRRLVDDFGVRVRVIGDGAGAMKAWGLDEVDQVEPVPLGAAYYTALTSLDIALVPLEDSTFNRAKSYLKALEFAAMKVPVVASPTPANVEFSQSVPIWLARGEDMWYDQLSAFIKEDQAYRRVTGMAYRLNVRKSHTYEANAHRWVGAWERALTRRARLAV